MSAPQHLIHEAKEFVRGLGQSDYEQLGEKTKARVGNTPTLRQAAFDRGERPLPGGMSSPPARRIGWEDDLQ